MSPLRLNLSELTRLQRQWSAMISHGVSGDGRLTEIEDFGSNPGELRMMAYVPAHLPAGAPLVVALHGCTQTAGGYDSGAGWSQLADGHGFAVLLPEQRRSNNAHTCFNWFEPADTARGGGEAASIRQMVARMVADHKLDAGRVFITGLSAGGAMAAAMLAAYPDAFAGGAIIAGLPYGAATGTQQALGAMHQARILPAEAWGDLVRAASPVRANAARPKVAIWHGDADQTVIPLNALESAKQWVDVHGLRLEDGIEDTVEGVPHRAWRAAAGSVQVELFAVPGLGHGTPITPGAEGNRGVGRPASFMLEAPISSTWQMAKSWGLLGAGAASPAEPKRTPLASLLSDPKAIITRGLRAVGLNTPD